MATTYLPPKATLIRLAKDIVVPEQGWSDERYRALDKQADARRRRLLNDRQLRSLERKAMAAKRRADAAYAKAKAAKVALIRDIQLNGPTTKNVALVKKLLGVK